MTKKVRDVVSVVVIPQRSNTDSVLIEAHATVGQLGWSSPKLVQVSTAKGVLVLDFVASPPEPISLPAESGLKATLTVSLAKTKAREVRVRGEQRSLNATIVTTYGYLVVDTGEMDPVTKEPTIREGNVPATIRALSAGSYELNFDPSGTSLEILMRHVIVTAVSPQDDSPSIVATAAYHTDTPPAIRRRHLLRVSVLSVPAFTPMEGSILSLIVKPETTA